MEPGVAFAHPEGRVCTAGEAPFGLWGAASAGSRAARWVARLAEGWHGSQRSLRAHCWWCGREFNGWGATGQQPQAISCKSRNRLFLWLLSGTLHVGWVYPRKRALLSLLSKPTPLSHPAPSRHPAGPSSQGRSLPGKPQLPFGEVFGVAQRGKGLLLPPQPHPAPHRAIGWGCPGGHPRKTCPRVFCACWLVEAWEKAPRGAR